MPSPHLVCLVTNPAAELAQRICHTMALYYCAHIVLRVLLYSLLRATMLTTLLTLIFSGIVTRIDTHTAHSTPPLNYWAQIQLLESGLQYDSAAGEGAAPHSADRTPPYESRSYGRIAPPASTLQRAGRSLSFHLCFLCAVQADQLALVVLVLVQGG